MSLATATTLIHISSVAARFLAVGEIIERHHGALFEVVNTPIPHGIDPSRVVVTCVNEQGGIVALTMHRDVLVKTYDEV